MLVSPMLTEAEVAPIMVDLEPRGLVSDRPCEVRAPVKIVADDLDGLNSHVPAEFAPTAPDEPAFIVYTRRPAEGRCTPSGRPGRGG